MTTASSKAIELFYSYAHTSQDEELLARLEIHLSTLEKSGKIIGWHRQNVLAGSDIQKESARHINKAQLILLLVSADYLASPYYGGTEMKRALERYKSGDARVIPILLRPAHLESTLFPGIQMLPSNSIPITSWPDYEEAFQDVVNGISQVIEDMTHSSVQSLPKEVSVGSALPRVWHIPYRQNRFFTGRESLLKQLHDTLAATRAAALTQPYAISGLGGIGKTQTAIEYAYRYRIDYEAVLWARATTRDTLISDFVVLAERLRLSKKNVQDQNVVIAEVKEWLINNSNWLFILDDIDDLDMIDDFLPLEITGHVLLTTRQQTVGGNASKIEVDMMDEDEGSLLLLRRSGRLKANALLDQAKEADRAIAKAIVIEMDGFPLALNQAGAYIDVTQCTLSDYLELYKTRFGELIQLPNGFSSDYPKNVSTTWSISFQRVEQENKAAAALLRLCAFLAPYAIPEKIITEGAAHLGEVLRPVAKNTIKLNEAMEVMQRYSLVRRNSDTKTLTVHRLVQAVFRDRMNAKIQQLWAKRAILAVNAAFPEVTYETWSDCQRYLLHAQACANLVEQYGLASPEAARLLTNAGWYLRERALYAQAEPLLKSALTIREHVLGSEHLDTATSYNNLAQLYRLQGEYEQAEPLCQQALAIRERVLGPEHPDTAFTLHDLGHLFYFQGEFQKAEHFYQRALEIREKVLGPIHPYTATTLNHLGMLYHSQGQYEKAEELYQRALAIREKVFRSNEHPLIATALNGLALLYYAQGKYKDAEELFDRARKIREQVLGPEHHHTTITLNHLGMLYQEQGRYKEAESLHQLVLTIREQALGSQHPDVAFTLNDLAHLYHLQGRYNEAEVLYLRARKIKEQKIGLRHPGTATTLGNLARLYQDQGRYDEAEPLYQLAYEIREQKLGAEHPHTLTTLNDLAHLYRLQGRYDEAEPLYQHVLSFREHLLGADHPSTAITLNDLANLYQDQGSFDQAEPLYKRAYEIKKQTLGLEHPGTATTLNDLARLYYVQRRYDEAEQLYRNALLIREKVLGPDHPDTAATFQGMAMLAQHRGRYEEAETLYQRALTIYKRVLGPDHPDTMATQASYASFLRKTNRD